MIIESLTKRLNRTELETVLWTRHLSLFLTIGFSASLEEFSFLAVLSDLDRWKYFKESLQIKYSYIVHKHLLSLQRYKRNPPPWWIVTYFSLMKVSSSSLWLPNVILSIFISLTTFCLIVNYLNHTNPHCFNSVPLGLQRLHQLPWTYYLLNINHGRNVFFTDQLICSFWGKYYNLKQVLSLWYFG